MWYASETRSPTLRRPDKSPLSPEYILWDLETLQTGPSTLRRPDISPLSPQYMSWDLETLAKLGWIDLRCNLLWSC